MIDRFKQLDTASIIAHNEYIKRVKGQLGEETK
uniref:Uncharacterized protein n=1 Tax=Klebsiella phage FKP3 TaxID=3231233 RepID=A0AAU8HYY2_9CAUD